MSENNTTNTNNSSGNNNVDKSNDIGIVYKTKKKFGKQFKILKITIIIIVCVAFLLLGMKLPTMLKHNETILDNGFKNVGYLTTQEWRGTILEDASRDRKILEAVSIPFTKSYLIFSLEVEVLAGVDFDKIEAKLEKNRNNDDILRIYLPHAKIEKSYEVQGSYKTHIDEENIFTNISHEEHQKLVDEMVKKGEEKAKDSGMLDKADANAENLIKTMLKNNSETKDYNIEFIYK